MNIGLIASFENGKCRVTQQARLNRTEVTSGLNRKIEFDSNLKTEQAAILEAFAKLISESKEALRNSEISPLLASSSHSAMEFHSRLSLSSTKRLARQSVVGIWGLLRSNETTEEKQVPVS